MKRRTSVGFCLLGVLLPCLVRGQTAAPATGPGLTFPYSQYLAEGATGSFFETRLAFFNPSDQAPADVTLTFQTDAGANVPLSFTLPAHGRSTLDVKTVPGLASASFSTRIDSSVRIVVDRTMSWDQSGYGSHAETAVQEPSPIWYFAEGSTSGPFSLFYLLQNPNDVPVTATVRYLRPFGEAPIDKVHVLPARSRTTIPVDDEGPELAATDVGAIVTATAPIVAERAMYASTPAQTFAAGHESTGVTAPATQWFLAEGATGPFFDLFILLGNPSATAADVRIDYLLSTGETLSKTYVVPALGRFTIPVDGEEIPAGSGQHPLTNVAVSSRITSTNDVPIVVERTMWWPSPEITAAFWTEAHNSPGTTRTAMRWALAEGESGGPRTAETYILIANTSAFAGQARVTLFAEDGSSAEHAFDLLPTSRTNVAPSADFPQMAGKRFGALIESLGATPAQLVVERAMYTSPNQVFWAAGTDAVGAILPSVESLDHTTGVSGTIVTIHGWGFTEQARVTFGGITAATTYDSPVQLRAVVPYVASDSGPVPLTPSTLDLRVDQQPGVAFTIEALPANPYPAGQVWQAFVTEVSTTWPALSGQMSQTWAAIQAQSSDPTAIAYAQAMALLTSQLQTQLPALLAQLQTMLSAEAMAQIERSLVAQGFTPSAPSPAFAALRASDAVLGDGEDFLEARGNAPRIAATLKVAGLVLEAAGLAGAVIGAAPLAAIGLITSSAGALTEAYISAQYGDIYKVQISEGARSATTQLDVTLRANQPVTLSAGIFVERSINISAAISLANVASRLQVIKAVLDQGSIVITLINVYLDFQSKLKFAGIGLPSPKIPLETDTVARPLSFSHMVPEWLDALAAAIDPVVKLDPNGVATRLITVRTKPSDDVDLHVGPIGLVTISETTVKTRVHFILPGPDHVNVTPLPVHTRLYQSVTLSAVAYDAAQQPIPTTFTWKSEDSAIASVDANGVVRVGRIGVTRVAAQDTQSGKTGTTDVIVSGDPHFWTVDPGELSTYLNQGGGAEWGYEFHAWYMYPSDPGNGAVRLWRFYDPQTETHFWTVDPNGELFPTFWPNARSEGAVGWVYLTGGNNRIAVRRFVSVNSGEHFWTLGAIEFPSPAIGFQDEGEAFWTPPPNAPGVVPMFRVRCRPCYGY